MQTIKARNVHQMLPEALHQLQFHGVEQNSRNGRVLRFPTPIVSVYEKPDERVEFHPDRDSNPFFHLMESLWMLAGRNDVEWIGQFNSTLSRFSDDGVTYHGAYGYRWRRHFGGDQLEILINGLKENNEDRRQVLQMWDAQTDLARDGKDVPCNLLACFGMSPEGKLDMAIYNRSNDMVWGCYGANAVHFSILHEYVASCVGLPLGQYYQCSFNLHLYLDTHKDLMEKLSREAVMPPVSPSCPYSSGLVKTTPLMSVEPDIWLQDLEMFMSEGENAMGYKDPFFRRCAVPMLKAYRAFKEQGDKDRFILAQKELGSMPLDSDWGRAGDAWLERRRLKSLAKHT